MNVIATTKKMTWSDFREMEIGENDHSLYELIHGVIMKRASPSLTHQDVSRRIEKKLGAFLDAHPIGKYYHAPVDVYLDENNGIIPDISFVAKERYFLIENNDFIAGAPDLIMEIVSPGNIRNDRVVKKKLYEQFAVKEYWIIDPLNSTVEVFVMTDNAYHLHAFEEQTGKIASTVLQGFELDIFDLF